MGECTLDWAALPIAAWEARFKRIRRSSLLQHVPYAFADRAVNQMGARHGLIRVDGTEAGLVQLGEVGLFRRALHVVHLDRGPLWFDGFATEANAAAFFGVLAREFPRRFARKRRILPELADSEGNRRMLAGAGFERNEAYQGYETIWVDLTPDAERLRARLDGNWRRFLAKSERTALTVAEDWTGATRAAFLATYAADRAAKSYSGPSERLVNALLAGMVPRREAVIVSANDGDRTVAAMLILLHGSSATYLVGWNLPEGRKLWAHHRLFWHALLMLKDRGLTDFDLGGVNDESAQGIKRFKDGLGGEFVKLVGLYR